MQMKNIDFNFLGIAEMYSRLKMKTCKSYKQIRKAPPPALLVNEPGKNYAGEKESGS
jgi:hypothetical protein